MPFIFGEDNRGCYVKWGPSGKKYHYTCGNERGRVAAKAKADTQRKAIEANK